MMPGDYFHIGDDVVVTYTKKRSAYQISLAILAPRDVKIIRGKLASRDKIQNESSKDSEGNR